MPPDATTVECILNVAAPGNPMTPYLVAGTIVLTVFILAASIIAHHWIERRNIERTIELNLLRRRVKDLEANGTL